MYDIIIQNNASKEVFLFQRQTPVEETGYYILFNLEMPDEVKSGEYTYAVLRNYRSDVEYTFKPVLMESEVYIRRADERNILGHLRPMTGIVAIETEGEDPQLLFIEGDGENNNNVYYYEG
jgi:hypothetical protein